MITPYETLGVSEEATEQEIKKAYRELSMKLHPDRNDGRNHDEFIAVKKAYELLSNPELRRAYDKYGPDYEERKRQEDLLNNSISHIFGEVIETYEGGDIITLAKKAVSRKISLAELSKRSANQELEKARNLLNRVFMDNGKNNIFEELVKGRVSAFQAVVERTTTDIAMGHKILEELIHYSDGCPDDGIPSAFWDQNNRPATQTFYVK